ncbi:hypothetical protein MANES_14G089000v8 [Manihot esculenta]|uniref:Uncharacterized protein n=1 Tax=Manihot esculenta TaxID=3983 RepID=A0ACB7GG28_MANES|nr:hypothetical protein MANES_14G089000v8 [Manihot esculenta]
MCTPWPTTRFIRWRLKDCVSCFLACRFPLDDDPDRVCSSLPQQPTRNMVFDVKKDEKRGRRADIKLSRRNRYRNETQLNPEDGNTVSMENKSNDPGWQHFQDEDYIVFCFKEDGTFDVVKDSKSEEALELFDSGNRNPRPVIRKLNYSKVPETVKKSSHEKISNAHGNDTCLRIGEELITVEEDEEEQNSYLEIESPSVASSRCYKFEKMENHGMLSVESCDSNLSESSTGSFSFPM